MALKIGVVGMGGMGNFHFRTYAGIKGAEVVAICDIDPAKLLGKGGVEINIGGGGKGGGDLAAENIKTFFQYNQIECVAAVTAQGPASCFVCGYGEDCKVGAIHMFFGPGTKITPDIIPELSKQPEKIEAARSAGKFLSERLRGFAEAT